MNQEKKQKLRAWSAGLCNASMLLYILWLFLPALQNFLGLRGGLAAIVLFAAAVLLDVDYLRHKGFEMLLRIAAAVLLPLGAYFFMHRGREFLSFFCQFSMFWFPAIFCVYVRSKNDPRLTRKLFCSLLLSIILTSATTIFWALYNRANNIENYSRLISMGWLDEEKGDLIMSRNIGGYDFSYALLLALPLVCALIRREKGRIRLAWLFAALLILLTLMATDYSYAMLMALIVVFVVLAAWLFRLLSLKLRRPLSLGGSLLCTLPLLLILFLFRMQLIDLGEWVFNALGLKNIAESFVEMRLVFTGQASSIYNSDSRLIFFGYAWDSFVSSPLTGLLGRTGSLSASQTLAEHYAALGLSGHSDILDVMASMGILGMVVVPLLIYVVSHGVYKGIRKSPSFPYLVLMLCVMFVMCIGSTVVYSREDMVILCLGALLLTQYEEKHQPPACEEKQEPPAAELPFPDTDALQ